MTNEDELGFSYLTDADIRFLVNQMREVRQAKLRMIGDQPEFEAEIVEILHALGIPVSLERIGSIAPPPQRRFGIVYKGRTAIITVAPEAALMG